MFSKGSWRSGKQGVAASGVVHATKCAAAHQRRHPPSRRYRKTASASATPINATRNLSPLFPTTRLLSKRRLRPLDVFAMDLNNIKKQVSNLTLYDLKAGVRKMQNGRPLMQRQLLRSTMLTCWHSCHELHGNRSKGGHRLRSSRGTPTDLTPSQVREATNNEPWGASSTQMQEIADGTFN